MQPRLWLLWFFKGPNEGANDYCQLRPGLRVCADFNESLYMATQCPGRGEVAELSSADGATAALCIRRRLGGNDFLDVTGILQPNNPCLEAEIVRYMQIRRPHTAVLGATTGLLAQLHGDFAQTQPSNGNSFLGILPQ